jgi:hypothetical protein
MRSSGDRTTVPRSKKAPPDYANRFVSERRDTGPRPRSYRQEEKGVSAVVSASGVSRDPDLEQQPLTHEPPAYRATSGSSIGRSNLEGGIGMAWVIIAIVIMVAGTLGALRNLDKWSP